MLIKLIKKMTRKKLTSDENLAMSMADCTNNCAAPEKNFNETEIDHGASYYQIWKKSTGFYNLK